MRAARKITTVGRVGEARLRITKKSTGIEIFPGNFRFDTPGSDGDNPPVGSKPQLSTSFARQVSSGALAT